MEEGKYYCPDISEFHVEFDYEVLHEYGKSINDPSNIKEWEGAYMWHDACLEDIIDSIKEGRIRVKCLDMEDIESCGWEYINKNQSSLVFSIAEEIFMDFYSDSSAVKIYYNPTSDTKIKIPYFSGTIRNISELKQIMKMTGIMKMVGA